MTGQVDRGLAPETFYERTSWPLGTTVRHPDDPERLGQIVKRGGRYWVGRSRLPMVRWHGQLDAEPIEWSRLYKAGPVVSPDRPAGGQSRSRQSDRRPR